MVSPYHCEPAAVVAGILGSQKKCQRQWIETEIGSHCQLMGVLVFQWGELINLLTIFFVTLHDVLLYIHIGLEYKAGYLGISTAPVGLWTVSFFSWILKTHG